MYARCSSPLGRSLPPNEMCQREREPGRDEIDEDREIGIVCAAAPQRKLKCERRASNSEKKKEADSDQEMCVWRGSRRNVCASSRGVVD